MEHEEGQTSKIPIDPKVVEVSPDTTHQRHVLCRDRKMSVATVVDRPNGATRDRVNGATCKWSFEGSRSVSNLVVFTSFHKCPFGLFWRGPRRAVTLAFQGDLVGAVPEPVDGGGSEEPVREGVPPLG